MATDVANKKSIASSEVTSILVNLLENGNAEQKKYASEGLMSLTQHRSALASVAEALGMPSNSSEADVDKRLLVK